MEQIISTVIKKPNQSPWSNVEVCQSHCGHNTQRFLLSLQQFFCQRIAEQTKKF